MKIALPTAWKKMQSMSADTDKWIDAGLAIHVVVPVPDVDPNDEAEDDSDSDPPEVGPRDA